MVSSFDLSKLNALLKDFYNLTRIRITVFDESFHELAAYPEQIAPFCRLIRTDPEGNRQCSRCDRQACETAARRRSPYTYRCHAGMTESITPLFLGNIIIGYLFFGHVFSYPSCEEGWEQVNRLCSGYHLDREALKNACLQQPLISGDYISSASHILQAVASYLCLERMASLRRQELPVRIDDYISSHFCEKIDAASICRHFEIGRTQLYEIARQNYGTGVAEHIRNLRIRQARELLRHTDLALSDIASQCGFQDYNYFITVFRRVTGMPPAAYRRLDG